MPTHQAAAGAGTAPAGAIGAKPLANAKAVITDVDSGLWWRQSSHWVQAHWPQILVATATGIGIVALLIGVRMLGMWLCRRDRTGTQWSSVLGSAIAGTRLWFIVPLAAHLVAGYASPPALIRDTIHFLFVVTTVLQAAIWARELVLGLIERRAGADDHQGNLGSALGLIRLLVNVGLFAIATVLILDNLGVNVTGLIAGLGIGGIAIGLAAQGIFSDLFAALAIIFDKPFRKGDSVRWDKTSGTVEAIGLKSTRIRAVTGEEVVISNANLLGKEVHNLARLHRRRIVLPFGLVRQTPPDVCARIPDIVRAIVEAHDGARLVRCGMIGFGASSLDYEVHFDVHSDVYEEMFRARNDVCIALLRAFNEAGIEFAYPTQASVAAPSPSPQPPVKG